MTTAIIITVTSLLLAAYLFDLTSSKTKIPSVILLLVTGWVLKMVTEFLGIKIPDLTGLLPILGTIGLILIVLEGALELEINKSKASLIKKSLLTAILPMVILSFGLAYVFVYFGLFSFRDGLINAIPLSIISSAIAIPSAKHLSNYQREFVTYESSLSDILGVLFFNFIALNYVYDWNTMGHFSLQVIISMLGSFLATIILAFMLSKIDHHIKFAPIILLIILIYAISKVFHLPGLIFILLFGLFMNNLVSIKRLKFLQRFEPSILDKEAHSFKELTAEAAFLIRALFFLVFGYLIETEEILNTETLFWAIGIVVAIILVRALVLKIMRLPLSPLLYIAPRGLITILLFLEIAPLHRINFVTRPLIIQVIVLSALVMMFGLMSARNEKNNEQEETNDVHIPEHTLRVKESSLSEESSIDTSDSDV
jgi:Kef-type K+ transport system membrane component KefB